MTKTQWIVYPDASRQGARLAALNSTIYLLAHQVVTVARDLLFPPHCVHCERAGSFLCSRCQSTLISASHRIVRGLDGICVGVDHAGAARAAIHALKYDGLRRLAPTIAAWIREALHATAWPIDLVTVVPLHVNRLVERGYNQSELLAQHVVPLYPGSAFKPDAVTRVRETASQAQLNAQARQENVVGAFVANEDVVAARCVLVIDDVLTTGATLGACATALRAAGAKQVFGAAAAGAVFCHDENHADVSGASV